VVVGLDVWREHFRVFADRYALVGGVACDTLMTDAGLQFRATKDLDVVLLVEVLDAAFAEAFWAFVEAAGYERKEKGEGGKLYRFAKPGTADYPFMIELFSRAPEGFTLGA
jgi:glutathionyl-hydroquinone reductase